MCKWIKWRTFNCIYKGRLFKELKALAGDEKAERQSREGLESVLFISINSTNKCYYFLAQMSIVFYFLFVGCSLIRAAVVPFFVSM